MKNYYYILWADAIQRPIYYHPDETNWKIKTFFYMTFSDALYYFCIATWLFFFDICDLFIDVKLTDIAKIDAFLSFAISFSPPFIIINYFFIFYKNRYEKIIKKYPLDLKRPKYAGIYCFTSLALMVITLTVYVIFGK